MNFFILDRSPVFAARYHQDVHVNSQSKEGAQLLSTLARARGCSDDVLYAPTHPEHPCAVWLRSSLANVQWGFQLLWALNNEFVFRGKGADHASFDVSLVAFRFLRRLREWPESGLTPFAQSLPERYRLPDAVCAYRAYYVNEKLALPNSKRVPTPAKWTARPIPHWLEEYHAHQEQPATLPGEW